MLKIIFNHILYLCCFREFSENEDPDAEYESSDENDDEIEIHCLTDILNHSVDDDDSEIILPLQQMWES